MKTITKLLAIWGCLATLPLLYMLCVYLDREGIVEFHRVAGTDYYHVSDLPTNMPQWSLTNAIPLSPDSAIKAAFRYATEKHPEITTWDVDRISLEKMGDGGIWYYGIYLINRQSGHFVVEYPRVLMDGTIWKTEKEQR